MEMQPETTTNLERNHSTSNPVSSDVISLTDSRRDSINNDPIERKNYEKTFTPKKKVVLIFVIYVCTVMTIGILVVCLTYEKPVTTCKHIFKPTVGSSATHNSRPGGIALGDINLDGRLDIIVANFGTDNIGILFGNANHTFNDPITYSTGVKSSPSALVVNYFNDDGLLDIIVNRYGGNSIGIFFGKSNGTFADMLTISTMKSRPVYIEAGDFNNDNRLDIIVVNYGTNSISIYLNVNNGTFSDEINYSMGYDSIPYSLVVGDFNQDKNLDVAVANYGTDNIAVLLGVGNGMLFPPTFYSTKYGSQPASVAIGDLNNDNKLDLVVANSGTHSIGIFYGHKDGVFEQQQLVELDASASIQFVATSDLNKDNSTDIIMLDPLNGHIQVLPGYGNRSFSNIATYITNGNDSPYSVTIANLNQNDQPDLAVTSFTTNKVLILMDYFSRYTVTQKPYSVGRNSHPPFVALGDFNSDHQLDIAVAKLGTDSIGVAIGYGNGSFYPEVTCSLPTGSSPTCISVGDLNGDGRLDLVVSNYGKHNIGILYGYGNGSFSNMTAYPTGVEAFPIAVTIGDFNNDSILDIAAANFRIDNVVIFI
ncbi:unnamed protein product, partial [Adineta ricciae]